MNVTEAVRNIEMKLEDLEMFLNVSLSNNIGDAIRTSYDIISDGAYGVAGKLVASAGVLSNHERS